MDKRTRSLIAVFSRPVDPARENEVRSWEERRLKKLLTAGIPNLVNISRYELRPYTMAKPSGFHWRDEEFKRYNEGQFATLYETSLEDPRTFEAELSSIDGSPPFTLDVIHKGFYRFQAALHSRDFKPEMETKGVLIAMVHPRQEKQYEEWYLSTHLDDEIRHGVHHSITRFINVDPVLRPRSFSVLETHWDDISEARANILTNHTPNWRYPAGITETFDVVAAPEYQRVIL